MFGREIDVWIGIVALAVGAMLMIFIAMKSAPDVDIDIVPHAPIPDAWVRPSDFFIG